MPNVSFMHTYKYICQTPDKKFFAMFYTGSEDDHKKISDDLIQSDKYISIARCYVCSIDPLRRDVEVVKALATESEKDI